MAHERGRQFTHQWRARTSAGVAALMVAAAGLPACGDSADPAGSPIKVVKTIGGLGDTPGRFAYPRCIEADGDSLWVIDKSARVQQIDTKSGRCVALWRMPEYSTGKPVGVTLAMGKGIDGTIKPDILYIPDTHYHRIMIYDPPRRVGVGSSADIHIDPVKVVGGYGEGPGQFYFPTDVVVLPAADGKSIDRFYVAEYGGNDRVSVFDADWNYLFEFGTLGPGHDPTAVEFNRPQAMQLWTRKDGTTELVIVDMGNHRLGRFTLDGKLIKWIGSPGTMGSALGQFNLPQGLKLVDGDKAMVTEFGGCRVQLVDLETGKGLKAWGRAGRGEGELANPWDSAVIGREVFVLDSLNNRVVEFRR